MIRAKFNIITLDFFRRNLKLIKVRKKGNDCEKPGLVKKDESCIKMESETVREFITPLHFSKPLTVSTIF